MVDVVRNRRVLLTLRALALGGAIGVSGALALASCSPARGEPVGVSHNGKDEPWAKDAGSPVKALPLPGLPPDFRTKLHEVTRLAHSEHQGAAAILWADDAGQDTLVRGSAAPAKALFVEELLAPTDGGTTTSAIFVLTVDGETARFGVADEHGATVFDDEGKPGSACARCHAEAPRAPVWIAR